MPCPGMRKEDCPEEKAKLAKEKAAASKMKQSENEPEIYYMNNIRFVRVKKDAS